MHTFAIGLLLVAFQVSCHGAPQGLPPEPTLHEDVFQQKRADVPQEIPVDVSQDTTDAAFTTDTTVTTAATATTDTFATDATDTTASPDTSSITDTSGTTDTTDTTETVQGRQIIGDS